MIANNFADEFIVHYLLFDPRAKAKSSRIPVLKWSHFSQNPGPNSQPETGFKWTDYPL